MENVYGDSFTAIAATNSTTFYPSNDVGGTTSTAAESVLADAKTVVIKQVLCATATAAASFSLQDHAGNAISTFTVSTSAIVNQWTFGPNGIRINSGWRIVQGGTSCTLIVVWKKLA